MNYQTNLKVNGNEFKTLADILPTKKEMEILFIAKTPAPKSVEIGHYFQGRQGKMFWNKLINHGILKVKPGTFQDENLIEHNYGITDIVKEPRTYGNEPIQNEYKDGIFKIKNIQKRYNIKVLVFIYKRVLDNILKLGYGLNIKTNYGMNPNLEKIFRSKVFVFPMPGTPCKSSEAEIAMNELKKVVRPSSLQRFTANNG